MSRYGLLLLCQVLAVFGAQLDNSGVEQWSVSPDGDGRMHVVNKRGLLDSLLDPFIFEAHEETYFSLYTPENPTIPQQIFLNDRNSLLASNFNPARPTRFSIHGWINNGESDINKLIREAYMKAGNFNVFVVDWSEGSFMEYSLARSQVDDVGHVVGEFIDFLYENKGLDFSTTYLAGHSLGAHVSGFAAKNVINGRIPVIFAMDPALPLFYDTTEKERLSRNDADYVEIIHTNANFLGYAENIGDASFYPNFGTRQNGCLTNTCAHLRAYEYFAESIITKTGFWAKQCQDWDEIVTYRQCTVSGVPALMGGEPARIDRGGVYYFPTQSRSPYAVGKF